jgi:hypothetical protein
MSIYDGITVLPCNCSDGECIEFVSHPELCVRRLARDHSMVVHHCSTCNCGTWHKDNVCIKCNTRKEE